MPERETNIRATLANVVDNRFEIGVIGQIKAGKSTFLNALCELPGFLPADVNPWTAVITRLCFTKDQDHAEAVFRFFTPEEWAQISESRTTTDRARRGKEDTSGQDGSEDAGLQTERQKIAERAERQLGPKLPEMLGREKRFELVTSEVLEQFLASGDFSDDAKPEAGKYSIITREAEIFLPLGSFSEDCTMVDTPGTNDSFKSRSRVTAEYLARADAYVLLINVHQALNSHEADLVKDLLVGLYKERMIVFINRVDQINDGKDSEKVTQRVRKWFRENYPQYEIPVLAGSAFWAEQSLGLKTEIAQDFVNKVRRDAVLSQAVTAEALSAWQKEPEFHLDAISKQMLACSGLPEARKAIAETLLCEKGRALLDSARGNLLAQAEALAQEARMVATRNDEDARVLDDDATAAQMQLDQLETKRARMQESKVQLGEARQAGEGELREVLEEEIKTLTNEVEKCLREQASREGKAIREQGIQSWKRQRPVDTVRIRVELENTFLNRYQQASHRVAERQKNFRKQIRRHLADVGNLGTVEIDVVLVLPIDPHPSLIALREDLALDLGNGLYRLFGGQKKRDDKAIQMEDIIKRHFENTCQALVQEAWQELKKAVEATIADCRSAAERAVARIESDMEDHRQLYTRRIREKDPTVIKKQVVEVRARASQQREIGARLDRLAEDLRRFRVSEETQDP
ncbi:MAG: [FeFe] hydrogenase H-cluster maturation GTPase HydF [Candidatus Accumulibacter phosphatis]|uniref:[FeFe] hydrogenase H-cluster maturation GTPase HydF n=1 Tax=Candidatus Accumulibacter phosphatis TaxID=327160 RepID=A0A080LS97_9PROT|nr:MAG: [FeFe] hydrogenase H-cluster maturation GTPase HydF [Candidatus Accumulibacter phosphatis]HRF12598.1 dynamin family protein [Candidatus Accumulibacter phosphatis]